MYKLAKWIYELGHRHAYEQIRADMKLYFGTEPVRYIDTSGMGFEESEKHFEERVDAWFAARTVVAEYFDARDQEEQ
jgi:hypothetical protein